MSEFGVVSFLEGFVYFCAIIAGLAFIGIVLFLAYLICDCYNPDNTNHPNVVSRK